MHASLSQLPVQPGTKTSVREEEILTAFSMLVERAPYKRTTWNTSNERTGLPFAGQSHWNIWLQQELLDLMRISAEEETPTQFEPLE
jgi:hypothetical protein